MHDSHEQPSESELWDQAHSAESSVARGEAWMELSHRRYDAEDYQEAFAYAEMASPCFQEADQVDLVGSSNYGQGMCLLAMKRYPEALTAFQKAVELWSSVGNEIWLADALFFSAEVQAKLGEPDEALILYASAARLYESNEHEYRAGNSLIEQGEILGGLGRASDALVSFTSARDFYTKAEHSYGAARANDRRASALIELGRVREALDLLRENIDLYTFLDAPWAVAHAQYRLGWTLNIDEQPAEAMFWLDAARAFYDQTDHPHHRANVDAQRVLALRNLGQRDEAERVGRGIRAFWSSIGNYAQLVLFEGNRALDLARSGHNAEAVDVSQHARELAESHCDDWTCRTIRLTHAELLIAAGTPERAREALRDDDYTEWGDAIWSYCRHLLVLAWISVHEGRPHEARGIVEKVIAKAEPLNMLGELATAHELLATLAEQENESQRARELRAQAVAFNLVAGQVAHATALARQLLPGESPVRRHDEWNLMSVTSIDDGPVAGAPNQMGSRPSSEAPSRGHSTRGSSLSRGKVDSNDDASPAPEASQVPQISSGHQTGESNPKSSHDKPDEEDVAGDTAPPPSS